MKNLYLFGGGGHALSCIDVVEKENKFNISGIFDKKYKLNSKILNYPILDEKKIVRKNLEENKYGLVCVGQIKTPKIRIKIFNELLKNNFVPATVISPFSSIPRDLKIGAGSIVMPLGVINSNTNKLKPIKGSLL